MGIRGRLCAYSLHTHTYGCVQRMNRKRIREIQQGFECFCLLVTVTGAAVQSVLSCLEGKMRRPNGSWRKLFDCSTHRSWKVTSVKGGTVAQWLVLSPHSNKVLGVSLDVALCVEFVLHVSLGVSVSSQTTDTIMCEYVSVYVSDRLAV